MHCILGTEELAAVMKLGVLYRDGEGKVTHSATYKVHVQCIVHGIEEG